MILHDAANRCCHYANLMMYEVSTSRIASSHVSWEREMRCSFQPWKVHPFLEDQGRHTSLSPVNGRYRGGVDLLPPTVNRP
ncbi:hypothetical protein IG631_01596 [Alternaria alternata]|nr:hypothetical protein IG631_01596 [Alternaria alternata]